MSKKILFILPFLAFFLISNVCFGGIEKYNARIVSPLSGNVEVKDARFAEMQANTPALWGFTNYSTNGQVILSIDQGNTDMQDDFSVEVEVGIHYYTYDINSMQFVNHYFTTTLSVSFDNLNDYTEKAVYTCPGAHWIYVDVISVSPTPAGADMNLALDAEIEVERYYEFVAGNAPGNLACSHISANNTLEFNWDIMSGAEEYDLEWVFINNYDGSYNTTIGTTTADLIDIDPHLFRRNSTRVTVSENKYTIPNIYSSGFLLYRIRGVGRIFENNELYTIEGVWTDENINYTNVQNFTQGGNDYYITISNGHEESLNWQYNMNFAEEGKHKVAITYYDGNLRGRQAVTKINANNTILVGETIYDKEGRAGKNILPVPSFNDKVEFHYNFNQKGTGYPYEIDDDIVYSGASRYYSASNPDLLSGDDVFAPYLPDAYGYPYAQTVYTPDNTGRIRAQGGIGMDHQIGTGREIMYYYGVPFQEELDPLFGHEVGYTKHYKKTLQKDPNGQLTVTYYDMKGNIIATGLAGSPPSNLQSLSTTPLVQTIVDLLSHNVTSIGSSVVNTQFLIDTNAEYEFHYNMQPQTFTEPCSLGTDVCFECVYNLSISLTDEHGVEYLPYEYNGVGTTPLVNSTIIGQSILTDLENGNYSMPATCSALDFYGTTGITWSANNGSNLTPVDLEIGEYTINKKLTVNQEALDYYTQEYLENNDCLQSYGDFYNAELLNIDMNECDFDCQDCIQDLGSDWASSNYNPDNACTVCLTEEQWEQAYNDCLELCDNGSPFLDSYYNILKQDVSKSGQYGKIHPGGTVVNGVPVSGTNYVAPHLYPLSVYNEGNWLPKKVAYHNPLSPQPPRFNRYPNWKWPNNIDGDFIKWYLNDYGTPDYVLVHFDGVHFVPDIDFDSPYMDMLQYIEDGVSTPFGTGTCNNCDHHIFVGQDYYKIEYLGNNEYLVAPELLTIRSFIEHYEAQWANSLVCYHPEYPYYVFYKSLDEIDDGSGGTISSLDFDYELLSTNNIASIGSHPVSNWLDGTVLWNELDDDPFFSANNLTNLETSFSMNLDLNGNTVSLASNDQGDRDIITNFLFNNYATDASGTTTYNIWELTWIINNNPTWNPSCGATTIPSTITFTTNEEWQTFRSLYLSKKQQLLDMLLLQNSMEQDYYNGCIGEDYYSPFSDGYIYHQYDPIANAQLIGDAGYPSVPNYPSMFYFPAQPCNLFTCSHYSGKTRRFSGAADMIGSTSFDNSQCYSEEVYGQLTPCPSQTQTVMDYFENLGDMYLSAACAQCPLERDLQHLLNQLAEDDVNNDLISTAVDLNCDYFTYTEDLELGLFSTLNGEASTWNGSYSGNVLTATIERNNTTASPCTLSISFTDDNIQNNLLDLALYDVSDIIGFADLHYTGSTAQGYEFTINAIVETDVSDVADPAEELDPGNADPDHDMPGYLGSHICDQKRKIAMNGYITCLDFTQDCEFEPICQPSADAAYLLGFLDLINNDDINGSLVGTIDFNDGLNHNNVEDDIIINSILPEIFFENMDQNICIANTDEDWSWYAPAPAGNTLIGSFVSGTNSNCNCEIELTCASISDFDDIVKFASITPDPNGTEHDFLVTAFYDNGTDIVEVVLDGYSECISFGVCEGTLPDEFISDANNSSWLNNGFLHCYEYELNISVIEDYFAEYSNWSSYTGGTIIAADADGNSCEVTFDFGIFENTPYNYSDIVSISNFTVSQSEAFPNGESYYFDAIVIVTDGTQEVQMSITGYSSCPIGYCAEIITIGCPANEATDFVLADLNSWLPFSGTSTQSSIISYGGQNYDLELFPLSDPWFNFNLITHFTDLHATGSYVDPVSSNTYYTFSLLAHATYNNEYHIRELQGRTTLSGIFEGCNECEENAFIQDFENYLYDHTDPYLADQIGFVSGYTAVASSQYTDPATSTGNSYAIYSPTGTGSYIGGDHTNNNLCPTTVDYTGNLLAVNACTKTNDFLWKKQVNVEPFTEYKFSVWVYLDADNTQTVTKLIDMQVEGISAFTGSPAYIYDCNETLIEVQTISQTNPDIVLATGAVNNDIWRKVEAQFTTGNQTSVELAIDLFTNSGCAYFGLDDIELIKTTCPPEVSGAPCDMPLFSTFCVAQLEDDCETYLTNIAITNANILYEAYIEDVIENFQQEYMQACMTNISEEFTMKYSSQKGHYTLYFYDQANNLVRTVPPKGVKEITNSTELDNVQNDRDNETYIQPTLHEMSTVYKYNSLNQMVAQYMPDHRQKSNTVGTDKEYNYSTTYYYDELGRLVASQNSEHRTTTGTGPKEYAYLVYDEQSRVIETGTVETYDLISETFDISTIEQVDYSEFLTWLDQANVIRKKEVVKTWYDEAVYTTVTNPGFPIEQENLRSRIASITYEDEEDWDDNTYTSAIHYNYDIHGNVKQLAQDNPHFEAFQDQRYKQTDYEYDLISGNVQQVIYQKNQVDQYMHKYEYDADNRITNVWTSTDGTLWEQDAKYFYYKTGSLARTEIGHNKIQGIDNAYTIQGWLKGVNSTTLVDESRDIGKDSYFDDSPTNTGPQPNKIFAKDAFGYALRYYKDDLTDAAGSPVLNRSDYASVGTTSFLTDIPKSSAFSNYTVNNLFNGNISGMVVANQGFMGSDKAPLTNFYNYDQLNRIVNYNTNSELDKVGNSLSGTVPLSWHYNSIYTYDANGNLTSLTRRDNTGAISDQLTYKYWHTANGVSVPTAHSNKLMTVFDGSGTQTFSFSDETGSDFEYDDLGNLIRNDEDEIDRIEWTQNGKVKAVTHNAPVYPETYTDLEFKYDPMGNRIMKIAKPRHSTGLSNEDEWVYTHYIRDAQGNIMAVYSEYYVYDDVNDVYVRKLKLSDMPVYGSNRLGTRNFEKIIKSYKFETQTPAFDADGIFNVDVSSIIFILSMNIPLADYKTDDKKFELTNHLGNVMGIVKNRKNPIDPVYEYVGTGSGTHFHENGVYDLLGTKEFELVPGSDDQSISAYTVSLYQANDYYPFGMLMPGRSINSSDYRFGFNGMEKDDEITGSTGNHYTTEFRAYDSRLGRWWSVDPVAHYNMSPYCSFDNKPIVMVDPKGDDGVGTITKAQDKTVKKGKKTKVISGGSKQNPHTLEIKANYYYNAQDLNQINGGEDALKAAIADYNNTNYTVELDDGNYYNVQFALTAVPVSESGYDDINKTHAMHDFPGSPNSSANYLQRFGNVALYDYSQHGSATVQKEVNAGTYGLGNTKYISALTGSINKQVNAGFSSSAMLQEVFRHEIGHNLGDGHASNGAMSFLTLQSGSLKSVITQKVTSVNVKQIANTIFNGPAPGDGPGRIRLIK